MGWAILKCRKTTIPDHVKTLRSFNAIYCPTEEFEELSNLTYKQDRNGEIVENAFNIDSHLFDAVYYSLTNYRPRRTKID